MPCTRPQWTQGQGAGTLQLLWQAPGSRRLEELPVTVPKAPFGPGPWRPLS